jgi:hypothetical protein
LTVTLSARGVSRAAEPPPPPTGKYKYSIFQYLQQSKLIFRYFLIQFLTNCFSIIILRFFMREFLENKKFFRKTLHKSQPPSRDKKKAEISSRRRREELRLTPLLSAFLNFYPVSHFATSW